MTLPARPQLLGDHDLCEPLQKSKLELLLTMPLEKVTGRDHVNEPRDSGVFLVSELRLAAGRPLTQQLQLRPQSVDRCSSLLRVGLRQ